jgi:hypothetical protein
VQHAMLHRISVIAGLEICSGSAIYVRSLDQPSLSAFDVFKRAQG